MINLSKIALSSLSGCALIFAFAPLASEAASLKKPLPEEQAAIYLKQLASPTDGIGAREAGTQKEQQTADFISTKFKQFGYRTSVQKFSYKHRDNQGKSSNIIAEIGDPNNPIIILGAHYDSTAMELGSMGATDNGAGIAAMLAIAEALIKKPPTDYRVRFIAFGAEEIGLQGSNYYVADLVKNKQLDNIIAMINFDTIAGGDKVYVHSAHTSPYKRCKSATYSGDSYSSDTSIRNALLAASIDVLGDKNQYVIHPDYEGYPEGVTGSWSDHASFACAGIPIAYVESTNFSINGKDGFDGYSQSSAEPLWTCFDTEQATACDRASESNWGKIWHTKFDSLEALDEIFPGRVEKQIGDNVAVLIKLLSEPERYLENKVTNSKDSVTK